MPERRQIEGHGRPSGSTARARRVALMRAGATVHPLEVRNTRGKFAETRAGYCAEALILVVWIGSYERDFGNPPAVGRLALKPPTWAKEVEMRRVMVGLIAAASLGLAVVATAAEHPDATVELKGGSVAVGIGFSWGSGTLHFKGKNYPITADGFDVGD